MGELKYRNNKLIAIVIVIAIGIVSLIGINLVIAQETMNANQAR